jgi:hypothetical protein
MNTVNDVDRVKKGHQSRPEAEGNERELTKNHFDRKSEVEAGIGISFHRRPARYMSPKPGLIGNCRQYTSIFSNIHFYYYSHGALTVDGIWGFSHRSISAGAAQRAHGSPFMIFWTCRYPHFPIFGSL